VYSYIALCNLQLRERAVRKRFKIKYKNISLIIMREFLTTSIYRKTIHTCDLMTYKLDRKISWRSETLRHVTNNAVIVYNTTRCKNM
jgi:hypothetical protein